MDVDFRVEGHGTVFLVHPQNDDARQWLRENVQPDGQWFGWGLAVEARFIGDLLRGARQDGLTIR